jgi:hypothetical protein
MAVRVMEGEGYHYSHLHACQTDFYGQLLNHKRVE